LNSGDRPGVSWRRFRPFGSFRPGLSFIGLLSFTTSFFGSRLFATLYPTVVVQQQGIHFHHFWYGIGLMALAGWLAITWKSERLDRVYAVMYGLGAGFIGDEVGLLLTFGNYQSTLTFDFFIGAISASLLLTLVLRYRVLLRKELSYLTTREGIALVGVFVTGFSLVLFAFNSLSLGTPLALVGIVVILRELLTKHDPTVEQRIPRGVTVIAALSIVGGANLIVAGIFSILYPEPATGADFAGLSASDIALVQTILAVLSVLAVMFGIFKILTGLILRNGKRWAWTLGMVASALSLTLDASSLGAYSTVTASTLEAPTSILAIIYLTRPYVRRFYGRGALSKREIVENAALG
jgi:hypothetical protein